MIRVHDLSVAQAGLVLGPIAAWWPGRVRCWAVALPICSRGTTLRDDLRAAAGPAGADGEIT
jgi:hypothetical protein